MSLLVLVFLSGLWPGPSRRCTCSLSGWFVLVFIGVLTQLPLHIILPWEPVRKHTTWAPPQSHERQKDTDAPIQNTAKFWKLPGGI